MGMAYDHIRVTPLATHVGAEISGIDLAAPPGKLELGEIRRAFGEYGVVFFRDQQLTPEQHIAIPPKYWANATSTASLRRCPAIQ